MAQDASTANNEPKDATNQQPQTKDPQSQSIVNPSTISDPVQQLSARKYLDKTIVPLLVAGLSEVVKQRPVDAVEYLAYWLLKNNPNAPVVQEPSNNNDDNKVSNDSNAANNDAK